MNELLNIHKKLLYGNNIQDINSIFSKYKYFNYTLSYCLDKGSLFNADFIKNYPGCSPLFHNYYYSLLSNGEYVKLGIL